MKPLEFADKCLDLAGPREIEKEAEIKNKHFEEMEVYNGLMEHAARVDKKSISLDDAKFSKNIKGFFGKDPFDGICICADNEKVDADFTKFMETL